VVIVYLVRLVILGWIKNLPTFRHPAPTAWGDRQEIKQIRATVLLFNLFETFSLFFSDIFKRFNVKIFCGTLSYTSM